MPDKHEVGSSSLPGPTSLRSQANYGWQASHPPSRSALRRDESRFALRRKRENARAGVRLLASCSSLANKVLMLFTGCARCRTAFCVGLLPTLFPISFGAVAQLARASPLQGEGPRFKSVQLHHFLFSIWSVYSI